MAAEDVTTLAMQCRIAAVDEPLREAIAVLGGCETFDPEEKKDHVDAIEMITVMRLARVGIEKIYDALRALKDLDPETRHG